MRKRIAAKTGEYQKDGEQKGEYVEIGVILENENGEYALINPTVNLAGVLMKQRLLAAHKGTKAGDMVSAGIYSDQPRQQNNSQQNSSGFGGFDDLSDPDF